MYIPCVETFSVVDLPRSRSPSRSNFMVTIGKMAVAGTFTITNASWLLLLVFKSTGENFFISLQISRRFVVLIQKSHCRISNIENLVAKIRSVKFSFFSHTL